MQKKDQNIAQRPNQLVPKLNLGNLGSINNNTNPRPAEKNAPKNASNVSFVHPTPPSQQNNRPSATPRRSVNKQKQNNSSSIKDNASLTRSASDEHGNRSSSQRYVDYSGFLSPRAPSQLMTPRGSYKDILVTPRGGGTSTTSLAHTAITSPSRTKKEAAHSHHSKPTPSPPNRNKTNKQEASKTSITTTTTPSLPSAPTSAPTSAPSVSAPIILDDLNTSLCSLQQTTDHRNRLSDQIQSVQNAVAQAQHILSSRKSEIEHMELLLQSITATLAMATAQATASRGDVDAARISLVQSMLSASRMLSLPMSTAALENELKQMSSSSTSMPLLGATGTANKKNGIAGASPVLHNNNKGTANTLTSTTTTTTNNNNNNNNITTHQQLRMSLMLSNSNTARSDISTSRYETPAESIAALDTTRSQSSSGSEYSSDMITNTNTTYDTTTKTSRDITKREVDVHSTAGLLTSTRHIPPLNVFESIPAVGIHTNEVMSADTLHRNSSRAVHDMPMVSPATIARLTAIKNKLEVAESIFSARSP